MSPAAPVVPVGAGLYGGYVRSRHPQEERHFEVIAGEVIDADGSQHRFAFARNAQAASAEAFAPAPGAAGVHADTPATVPCDGDAGLWQLQRETLPGQLQREALPGQLQRETLPGQLQREALPGQLQREALPGQLQRETLPAATLVLDRWLIAMRFEHALQAAR